MVLYYLLIVLRKSNLIINLRSYLYDNNTTNKNNKGVFPESFKSIEIIKKQTKYMHMPVINNDS